MSNVKHHMRPSPSLLCSILLLLVTPCGVSLASEPFVGMTEADAWEFVESSPKCKDPAASSCEALRMEFYCTFSGSSRNAIQCAGGRRNTIESDLNRDYRKLLKDLSEMAKTNPSWAKAPKLFVEAQRAWVVLREKDCAFVAESFAGGTLQPALAEDCMREAAETRIETFREYRRTYSLPE